MENNGTLEFDDLAPKVVRVRLGKEWFELREPGANAGRLYKTETAKGLKFIDGKVSGLAAAGDIEPLLVSLCLFKEGADKPVGLPFVLAIKKSTIVKQLYNLARDMGDLVERGEADPDPELIGLCRKDLSDLHHPDRGGSEDLLKGVNLALDWLKDHQRKSREDRLKNSQTATAITSE